MSTWTEVGERSQVDPDSPLGVKVGEVEGQIPGHLVETTREFLEGDLS